jgi:hypothetical protein
MYGKSDKSWAGLENPACAAARILAPVEFLKHFIAATSTVQYPQLLDHCPMALNALTPAPISVDESLNDADSSYGGEGDAVSETTSLYSAITNHVYENGRRYHSYRAGSYWYHFLPHNL